MTLPRLDTQHHTFGEYLTWPENHPVELVDGVAYVKEPAPAPLHQALLGGLHWQIFTALEGTSCCVYTAPFDVRLPDSGETDEKIGTVVQPDIVIVCDHARVDRRGLRGAPDWLAEILSPGTASHDLMRKVPAYERAGVPEVWLIYPTDRKVTMYRLEDGHYPRPAIVEMKGRTPLAAVPEVIIDWDRLIARLDRVRY